MARILAGATLLLMMGLWGGIISTSAEATPWDDAPRQLNIDGWSACLSEQSRRFDLNALRDQHGLGRFDLLLSYLAVYPNRRLGGEAGRIQALAHARWSERWDHEEAALVESFWRKVQRRGVGAESSIAPGEFFGWALKACEENSGIRDDIFCAALIGHNVLRTLGRHQKARLESGVDLNPRWFKRELSHWMYHLPALRRALMPLRVDGGGDRWGEWYHFFGVLAYAIRERAVGGSMEDVDWAVRMNRLLNPILAGGFENSIKARIDRDSAEVAARYLGVSPRRSSAVTVQDCSARGTYVLAP